MSDGEDKTYCKPTQVSDQTDGKVMWTDRYRGDKNYGQISDEIENVQLSKNISVVKDLVVRKKSQK